MFSTIDDCYQYFSGLYGSEKPNRGPDWLRSQIHNRDLRYEDVTKDLLGELWDAAVYDAFCIKCEEHLSEPGLYGLCPDCAKDLKGACGCPYSELDMPEFGVFVCPKHGRTEV